MKLWEMLRIAAVGLAMLGMLAPQIAIAGGGRVPDAPRAAAGMPAIDVALQQGGVLAGQVVDAQGSPKVDSPIAVRRHGQTVGSSRTDAEGHFAIAGLQAGVYQLETAEGSGLCRLWTAEAAPPAAHDNVLVVCGQEVVRGQHGHRGPDARRRLLLIGGMAAAAGVIGGVIGYNIRQPAS